ncbi:hypothetical protein Pstu01_18920, partial [Stutzerimonas stutzeri]
QRHLDLQRAEQRGAVPEVR